MAYLGSHDVSQKETVSVPTTTEGEEFFGVDSFIESKTI
jgi:hypothetical protein